MMRRIAWNNLILHLDGVASTSTLAWLYLTADIYLVLKSGQSVFICLIGLQLDGGQRKFKSIVQRQYDIICSKALGRTWDIMWVLCRKMTQEMMSGRVERGEGKQTECWNLFKNVFKLHYEMSLFFYFNFSLGRIIITIHNEIHLASTAFFFIHTAVVPGPAADSIETTSIPHSVLFGWQVLHQRLLSKFVW